MNKLRSPNDNFIELEDAERLIKNFQRKYPDKSGVFSFGDESIVSILGQDEAMGFKLYIGCSDDNSFQLVMVGLKRDGSEMWPSQKFESTSQIVVGTTS